MNQGLVLLAAWAQWLLLVGLLATAVVRRVDRIHDSDRDITYERPHRSDPA